MATKTVYAIIAAVIIAIVAIGAAVILNNNGGDDGVKGVYELQQGTIIEIQDDVVTSSSMRECNFTIKSDENGLITADWAGTLLVGGYDGGYMHLSGCYSPSADLTYNENIYALVENGVVRLVGIAMSDDQSIKRAMSCVFAKEGAVVPNDVPAPILEKGTVFKSFSTVYVEDGELKDIDIPGSMTVEETYGLIYIISVSKTIDNTSRKYTNLAIQTGSNTLLMLCGPIAGYSTVYTDGKNAQVNYNYKVDGSNITTISCMTSEDGYEFDTPSELAGKVYRGTNVGLSDDGGKFSDTFSVSFGDDLKGVFSLYGTYGETGFMNQATAVKDPITGGYYIAFNGSYMYEGLSLKDTVTGYITGDLSKMYLSYVTFCSDGTAEYSESELTLTDEISILGTYDFRSGNAAYMKGSNNYYFDNFDTSGGLDRFAITYYDGDFAVAKWGPETIYGAVNNDGIVFTGAATTGEGTFMMNEYAVIKNGIITFTAVGINEDDSASYAFAVMLAKEGLNVAIPEFKSILDIGSLYNLKRVDVTIDGESIDTEGVGLVTQVICESKGISVVENAYKFNGEEKVDLFFAVGRGSHSLKAVFVDERRFADVFVDKDLMIINTNYVMGGKNIVASEMMVKGSDVPTVSIPDFSGLVYTGVYGMMGADGQYYRDVTIVFGEYVNDHILASLTVGGNTVPVTFQVVIKENGDVYGISMQTQCIMKGCEVLDMYRGMISKDLKTLCLTGSEYSKDDGYHASKCFCTLVEDDAGIVGCYSMTVMDHISGTDTKHYEIDNPYGYYFTVTWTGNGVVSGTFLGKEYLGFINNDCLQFRISESNLTEYANVFFYDGSCAINIYGVHNGLSFANYLQFYKEGAKKIEELPAPDNIFKEEDLFICYEGSLVRDGVQLDSTSGQKLECIVCDGWLYAFKFTSSDGATAILNGCGSPSGPIKVAGLYKGEYPTFNIMKLSDNLVFMDREFMNGNANAVVTFKMTADGSSPILPEGADLNGYTYMGTSKEYTIVDGTLIETDLGQVAMAFKKTTGSITYAVRSDGTNDVKLLITDSEGKPRATESFSSFTMGSEQYKVTYVALISDDLKTITQYGYGNTSDGTPVVVVMEYTLNNECSVIIITT